MWALRLRQVHDDAHPRRPDAYPLARLRRRHHITALKDTAFLTKAARRDRIGFLRSSLANLAPTLDARFNILPAQRLAGKTSIRTGTDLTSTPGQVKPLLNPPPSEMSGGQQRVAVARAHESSRRHRRRRTTGTTRLALHHSEVMDLLRRAVDELPLQSVIMITHDTGTAAYVTVVPCAATAASSPTCVSHRHTLTARRALNASPSLLLRSPSCLQQTHPERQPAPHGRRYISTGPGRSRSQPHTSIPYVMAAMTSISTGVWPASIKAARRRSKTTTRLRAIKRAPKSPEGHQRRHCHQAAWFAAPSLPDRHDAQHFLRPPLRAPKPFR